MNLKCVAIDDEPLALQLIKTYVARIPSLALTNTFEDAITAIEYLNANETDLLFLDINMPDISGIDLAAALRNKPMIIFTTAYKEFAYDGFRLEAIDYLLKPLEFDSFSKAVQKAQAYKKFKTQPKIEANTDHIYINSEYKVIKVNLRDIEYVESMEDYVKIHIGKDKPLLSLMTLKKMSSLLPANQFIRIHRSYIIPKAAILSLMHKKVQLANISLPIGDRYADELKRLRMQ